MVAVEVSSLISRSVAAGRWVLQLMDASVVPPFIFGGDASGLLSLGGDGGCSGVAFEFWS